jgi:hypothetical protein
MNFYYELDETDRNLCGAIPTTHAALHETWRAAR